MKRGLSAYLDLLRIAAAGAVFIEHLSYGKISGGFLWRLGAYGHSAVITFFVLSGFVIAFAADQKEKTLLDFSVARFARLYSVVIPALLLTLICDFIGTHHNPAAYYATDRGDPVTALGFGALFLTQSWQKISLLSNRAFWSLPYEFWYYQIFAAALFLGGWLRIAAISAACLIAGPAILLLFPIWLMGAYAYRFSKTAKLTYPNVVWCCSGLLALAAIMNNAPMTLASPFLPAAYSTLDYLIGALLAINIMAASQLDFPIGKWKQPISYFAGMTFALYLFHLPLLHLAAAYVPASWPSVVRGVIVGTFALTAVYLLSFITERQRHRWRALFYWIFGLLRFRTTKTALASTQNG